MRTREARDPAYIFQAQSCGGSSGCQLNPEILQWSGERRTRSLGRPENGHAFSSEQCKESWVVEKLAQEGLEKLRPKQRKVPSSTGGLVLTTSSHIISSDVSHLELAYLQLLAFVSLHEPPARGEKKLQSQSFSPESCTEEMSVPELYRMLKDAASEPRPPIFSWYVLSGEQASIMSCVQKLCEESSPEGGAVASDLAAIWASLRNCTELDLQVKDNCCTNYLLTFWVKADQGPQEPPPFAKYRSACRTPGPPGDASLNGRLVNGSRIAVDYLNSGDLSKRIERIAASKVKETSEMPPLQLNTLNAIFGTMQEDLCTIKVLVQLDLHANHEDNTSIIALYHSSSSHERMEFFFGSPEDMAACVGVGLPQSKVVIDRELGITVHELEDTERESQAAYLWQPHERESQAAYLWQPHAGRDNGKCQVPVHIGALHTPQDADEAMQMLQPDTGDEILRHKHESREAAASQHRWPILYELVWALLTRVVSKQCADAPRAQLGPYEGPQSSLATMLQNLDSKRQPERVPVQKGKRGGGDGEDTSSCIGDSSTFIGAENEDLPVQLTVTMMPLSKHKVVNAVTAQVLQASDCEGLENATIRPKLEFVFRRAEGQRRITIHAMSSLGLATAFRVTKDTRYPRWYHNDILISLGSVERCIVGAANDRVVYLEPLSPKMDILGAMSNRSSSTGRTSTESSSNGHIYGGRVGGDCRLLDPNLGCDASVSQERKETSSQTEISKAGPENDAGNFGFLVQDRSNPENDACIEFYLHHPQVEETHHISKHKAWLEDQGLFSTIEPEILGTWVAINKVHASPYRFNIERNLKLEESVAGRVHELRQSFSLSFRINHAMNHLDHRGRGSIKLTSLGPNNQVSNVANVLRPY